MSLKIWPSVNAYSIYVKNICAKFLPNPIWNDAVLSFFLKSSPQQEPDEWQQIMSTYRGLVINFLRPLKLDQNMPYLSSYHQPVQNYAKCCENIEIPQKLVNSMAWLKIPHSVQNCGP